MEPELSVHGSPVLARLGRGNGDVAFSFHSRATGKFTIPLDRASFDMAHSAGFVYCAWLSARIVGICYVKPSVGLDDRGDHAWVIGGLFIEPVARRRGLASKLGQFALADSISRFTPQTVRAIIHCANDASARLFTEVLGFERRGEHNRLSDSEAPPNLLRIDGEVVADYYELPSSMLETYARQPRPTTAQV